MENVRDIFISYKDDGDGKLFAAKLAADLKSMGYDVYYNADEQHSGSFPDRLRIAVENCNDFIIILSRGCLDQLMRYEKVDWIREELLTAHKNNKNIIPVLMPGVSMPKDKDEMPEELSFLPEADGIKIYDTDNYNVSSLDSLTKIWIKSSPAGSSEYKYVYQSNDSYDVDEDFQKALASAKAGDPAAMYEVANMYFYGVTNDHGTSERNFAEAYRWFDALSKIDCEYRSSALTMIGKMYYKGIVPREKQSYAKTLEYYRMSENENMYAHNHLSFMMSLAMGCNFDYEKVEERYIQSLDIKDNVAITDLTNFYKRSGEFQKAADLYQQILGTFPRASYELGCMYMQGILDEQKRPDYFKAAFYFQNAINAGYRDADVYYQLGLVYFRGSNGFIVDFKIAQENFQKASDLGHSAAQYMLAYMYEFGYNEVDLDKAVYYHTQAAEKGHILSPYHLSVLYQLPQFKNYQQAYKYAKMSADLGDREGEYMLGILLFLGRGCKADEDKAYEQFRKAYGHGMEQAKFMMDKIDRRDKDRQ